MRSQALFFTGQIKEAHEALSNCATAFANFFAVPCYAAALGRLDEAREWLAQAFACDGETAGLKRLALEDPQFKELWQS